MGNPLKDVIDVFTGIAGVNEANNAQQNLERAYDLVIDNIREITLVAADIIETGYNTALNYYGMGLNSAADSVVSYTQASVDILFDSANYSEDMRKRFMHSANMELTKALETGQGYLDPYFNAGVEALDEMQAMLGIGDEEFDPNKITETPGYKFINDQAMQAVDTQAVGTKLSGAQVEAAQENAAGISSQYYNDYMKQLEGVAKMGLDAGKAAANLSKGVYESKADLKYKTGAAIGDDHMKAGLQASKNLSSAGDTLAKTYLEGYGNLGSLSYDYYGDAANLWTGQTAAINDAIIGKHGGSAKFAAGMAGVQQGIGSDLGTLFEEIFKKK